jgi:thiosulfate/3-mercaptopyruvate sulfurtransferase
MTLGVRMSRNEVLVDAEWVLANKDRPDVVVVEVDEDVSAYDDGHIDGAVRIDWREELQDPIRRDFLSPEAFAALLGSKGIAPTTTVVLYGGNNNWFSAYAYWYLKLYGHQNVRLLDGGRKKWELEGRPLVLHATETEPTTYPVPTEDRSIRAGRDDVLQAIGAPGLLDVRSPDEYSGRLLAPAHLPQEQSQRPGHVPTAVNVPWSRTANDDGTFRSDEELTTLYASVGVDAQTPVIAYCRIGERSAHTWFVLHELLEFPDVRNYDGSWTEYGSLVGVPVQLGEEPGSPLGGAA